MYSGFCLVNSFFAYGAFTLFGRLSQNLSAKLIHSILQSEPHNISIMVWPLSLSLAATYEIDVSFSSSGYLDVSVHRVPFHTLWIGVWIHEDFSCGFPHSDICGLLDICSSPQLFAAYHVFLRLLVPRHPPCALFCLTSRCIALQLLFLQLSSLSFELVCLLHRFHTLVSFGCLDCFFFFRIFNLSLCMKFSRYIRITAYSIHTDSTFIWLHFYQSLELSVYLKTLITGKTS